MSSPHQLRTDGRPFDRGTDLLSQIEYRLMETDVEKDAIYRLRYTAYLNEGAIDPSPAQRTTDRYDDLPNSWIFGVYYGGMLASSIRISVAMPGHPDTPSMAVFPELLQPELERGKILVDPTRFVADPSRTKRFPELPYMTLRLAYLACHHFNADIGLASVRVEHQAFYRRVFLHQPWSQPRQYPGLTKPICLMAVDYPSMRDRVFARYPYLRSSYFERQKLFQRSAERQLSRLDGHDVPFDRATITRRS
jgi:hypothetical protein